MNKGAALLILGGLAVLGGAVFAALVIKNKLARCHDIDFDEFEDYDDLIDDEELKHFLGEKDAEDAAESE